MNNELDIIIPLAAIQNGFAIAYIFVILYCYYYFLCTLKMTDYVNIVQRQLGHNRFPFWPNEKYY